VSDSLDRLCQHLRWIGNLYQISGANIFQIRAWHRASENLKYYLADYGNTIPSQEFLESLPGLGKSLCNEILDWYRGQHTRLLKELESRIHEDLQKIVRGFPHLLAAVSVLHQTDSDNRELWLDRLEANYFSILNKMKAAQENELLKLLNPSLSTICPKGHRGTSVEGDAKNLNLGGFQFVFHTHPLPLSENCLQIRITLPLKLMNSDETAEFASTSRLLPLHYILGVYQNKDEWNSVLVSVLTQLKQPVFLWYPLRDSFLKFCDPLFIPGEHLYLPSWRSQASADHVQTHLNRLPKDRLVFNATASALLRFLGSV